MTARSSYPVREGFFLDKTQRLTEYLSGPFPATPNWFSSARTIRIIVLGTVPGPGYWFVRVTFRSKFNTSFVHNIDFLFEDFDANGVGIAHFRLSTDRLGKDWHAYYNLFGGATVQSVYLDAVENIA